MLLKCDRMLDKIRKKLNSLNGYEDDFILDKLTQINTLTNEILDHCDINRKALFNKDKFEKIKHILEATVDGTSYYTLEFNNGDMLQSSNEYQITETDIIFYECAYCTRDRGEEVSEYNLTKHSADEVYAVRFYSLVHNQDEVIFI